MRTMKIVTIACWTVTALVIIGLAAWFLTGTLFGIRTNRWNTNWSFGLNVGGWETLTGPFELVGAYSVGVDGLDSLNVDWIAGQVTVKPHDGNEIQIKEYAQRELNDNENLVFSTSGSMLTIRYHEPGVVGRVPQKRLEVLIPRPLCEAFGRLTVDSVSGGVAVSDINADVFETKSTSGSIEHSNITSRTFNIDSTSGSITLSSVNSGDMRINSLSGSIRVYDSDAKSLVCDSTSGSINISGDFNSSKIKSLSGRITLDNSASRSALNLESTSGSLEISGSFENVSTKSLSGSVSIRSTVVPASLNVDTTSGSITIAVPNEGEISVHHSSTSGKLSSDIPIIIQNRDARFELSSLSGSAKILAID